MRAKQSARSKAPRRQGRPPKDDLQALRDKIVAATRELLRTRPPDTISRVDIARAARVDPALIRYYFGTRDDVLSAVAQTFMNDFVSDSLRLAAERTDSRSRASDDAFHDDLSREISVYARRGGA